MTLEGTIIHKSGLITGGRSTHNNNKKWDEKDVQGLSYSINQQSKGNTDLFVGLIRTRDNLLTEQRELSKQKPRGKTDESLISDISRLESVIIVAKDDLVGKFVCINF